jgi:hypothetical protein
VSGTADGGTTALVAALGGALPRVASRGRRYAAMMQTASPLSVVLVSRRRRYCRLGTEFDAVKHRFLTFCSSVPLFNLSVMLLSVEAC